MLHRYKPSEGLNSPLGLFFGPSPPAALAAWIFAAFKVGGGNLRTSSGSENNGRVRILKSSGIVIFGIFGSFTSEVEGFGRLFFRVGLFFCMIEVYKIPKIYSAFSNSMFVLCTISTKTNYLVKLVYFFIYLNSKIKSRLMLQVGNTHESKGRRLEESDKSEDLSKSSSLVLSLSFFKSFFSKSEDLQRVICYRSSL